MRAHQMRNSNVGNISIAIPTESRLRTFSDIDDRSVYINEDDNASQLGRPRGPTSEDIIAVKESQQV